MINLAILYILLSKISYIFNLSNYNVLKYVLIIKNKEKLKLSLSSENIIYFS